jgi:hypothetical protein
MHGEFLRLLFLQAHRGALDCRWNITGISSQNCPSDSFRFKRAAFYQSLKSKVGLAASKAAALRINLNARSFSRSPSPPPSSFTQYPSPPRSLVRDGQTSPLRPRLVVSRSTCPALSPSPHANSLVIGTAVMKTHTRKNPPAVYVSVVECAPASLPPASSSLTHTRRMDGFCNQNADQLESLAGLSFLAVYVGVVECAPASPYTYSSSTHRFPDERTPIEATPLSATSAELGLGLGLGLGLDSLSHSSSHALPFFSPPCFHTLALSPAFTSVWWSA